MGGRSRPGAPPFALCARHAGGFIFFIKLDANQLLRRGLARGGLRVEASAFGHFAYSASSSHKLLTIAAWRAPNGRDTGHQHMDMLQCLLPVANCRRAHHDTESGPPLRAHTYHDKLNSSLGNLETSVQFIIGANARHAIGNWPSPVGACETERWDRSPICASMTLTIACNAGPTDTPLHLRHESGACSSISITTHAAKQHVRIHRTDVSGFCPFGFFQIFILTTLQWTG